MAKKKYIRGKQIKSGQHGITDAVPHPSRILKQDWARLEELKDILNSLPIHEQTESIRTDLKCYALVRDTFIAQVRHDFHDIRLDRSTMSEEEKLRFHEVLTLALWYLLADNNVIQHPYTKEDLRENFNIPKQWYEWYYAMIKLLPQPKILNEILRKGFTNKDIIKNGSPAKGLKFALQGVKLFLQRKANNIKKQIQEMTWWYEKEISNTFVAQI